MADRVKANGIHYTPTKLAAFLAGRLVEHADTRRGSKRVLDPACGDGALLNAFVAAYPAKKRNQLTVCGHETDSDAMKQARAALHNLGVADVSLDAEDFLKRVDPNRGESHTGQRDAYDFIIANPPYVRTQVLGTRQSRLLAERFGLTGRVDLYHAFVVAMSHALKSSGLVGLLTSNRFLTTRSGQSLRKLLREQFDILELYDLGDTKLFSAAVLPAVVVCRKRGGDQTSTAVSVPFTRVYATKPVESASAKKYNDVVEILRASNATGPVATADQWYQVEHGTLRPNGDPTAVWMLSTPESEEWIQTVRSSRACTIGDLAKVRVGIKTTADDVFVRDDWETLSADMRPEPSLLYDLITHHEAARWTMRREPQKKVLYPHVEDAGGKRQPVDLQQFPRAERVSTNAPTTIAFKKVRHSWRTPVVRSLGATLAIFVASRKDRLSGHRGATAFLLRTRRRDCPGRLLLDRLA